MPARAIKVHVKANPASAAQVGPNFHTITMHSTPLSSSTNGYWAEMLAWQ
jgi:hypothetical protein